MMTCVMYENVTFQIEFNNMFYNIIEMMNTWMPHDYLQKRSDISAANWRQQEKLCVQTQISLNLPFLKCECNIV